MVFHGLVNRFSKTLLIFSRKYIEISKRCQLKTYRKTECLAYQECFMKKQGKEKRSENVTGRKWEG